MPRNYYINSNGRIRRKENTVYFETEKDGESLKTPLPINDIDTIFIFGEVDINTKAINYLSQYDIPMHFFNYYGYYSGSFLPRKKNVSGSLLVEQVKHHIDDSKRQMLAISFIEGAVHHILRNLRKSGISVENFQNIEKDLLPKIFETKTIEELMAIEGNIREHYYQLFNTVIKNKDFFIEKREKRPPTNPINALISFGNSIMYNTVLTEIYRTQLDPTISYLHSPQEKRFSLSLDIAEIFKPFIIDPLIFNLIKTGQITIDDFDKDLNYTYLNENGRKKFLKAYEERLSKTVKHRRLKRNVSYRQLIRLECYKLIKHLIGDEIYKPFKAWW
ncbi:type I-B CRISPR-associated endonuclease Cas1b [Sulfurihydrogenibium azorense]|jgi:CRISPR-associated protein Cas1|uniref:CRISPR-associated endonuclease Cas1 n=1 Tax=Sulfurihydrogenibium azorense (strain DSM 15241 / OCM 825 / Az-Fu1) TaxID=204536 RepID=C1DUM1_SULAA|nr:type I-B CRISPR-associated endonuclease Cas1b [Sulfurihydrogenibium azorense]ACN98621.1 crispr-associated protein Cas1 [Sulfurihydrogenibium azorense Az-Fu1]MDM7273050.1 type I-B CRISPR-associated endonuclease Cas1b [Sulfurihydrogenibium azorense]